MKQKFDTRWILV